MTKVETAFQESCRLLSIVTQVPNGWYLFVNEDKDAFTHVQIDEKEDNDDQCNFTIAGDELWQKIISRLAQFFELGYL